MNSRLKTFGKFTFQFSTAIYLLAVPVMFFTKGGDALLPYEAALCAFLSSVNGGMAIKNAWRTLK